MLVGMNEGFDRISSVDGGRDAHGGTPLSVRWNNGEIRQGFGRGVGTAAGYVGSLANVLPDGLDLAASGSKDLPLTIKLQPDRMRVSS